MNESKDNTATPQATPAGSTPSVKWDDSSMQTSYANVVNASSTREEVSLFFGTNQTWDFRESKEFAIQLNNRIVLNPFAAKRMLVLLSRIIGEYEKRFGELHLDAGGSAPSAR